MESRYTILQHETRTFYLVDCPILLVSHAITKDNQNNTIFVQCKFENTLSKPIKALYISVKCYDVTNQSLSDVESFSYLDILVKQYETFGDKMPVILPDKETRNISIIPVKIVFEDGSTWENETNLSFVEFEYNNTTISELGELAEEYRRELHHICLQSDRHNYLPIRKDGYTICGCGKIVVEAEKTCPACGVDLEKLFALNDVERLRKELEQGEQGKQYVKEMASNIETPKDEPISSKTPVPIVEMSNEENQTEHKSRRVAKIALIAGLAGIMIVAFSIGLAFALTPKELQQVTTLENGSTVSFKGAYIMEVPCYSYSTYEKDFDTAGKDFLCIALDIANSAAQDAKVEDMCSGEIRNGKEIMNDDILYMGEKKSETTVQVPPQARETVLMAFPVPENKDMQKWTTIITLGEKSYKYSQGYQDVRQFVRDMYDQMLVSTNIMSDITGAIAAAKQLSDQSQDVSGLMAYIYVKQIVDGIYEDLSGLQARNRDMIEKLNELKAPDIQFYQQTKQDMIDDANERITKLESLNDVDYPTDLTNVNTNADAVLDVLENFPNAGLTDMLTMGQHWLVDFNE